MICLTYFDIFYHQLCTDDLCSKDDTLARDVKITWPEKSENVLNAWYLKCKIQIKSEGKLAGKTIVLKDNIFCAGLPMMNGSAVVEGYTPTRDASVVSRILAEGGVIVGKARCECLCFSGGSHTNIKGNVLNPHNHEHSSGGSSSGCAALLAAGEVDMAIGGDQGGSIRIPSSWCGTYGMKVLLLGGSM